MFSVTIADIEKALRVKSHTNPRTKLPERFYKYLPVFDRKAADQLPLLRGNGIDHRIELEKREDGTEPEVP